MSGAPDAAVAERESCQQDAATFPPDAAGDAVQVLPELAQVLAAQVLPSHPNVPTSCCPSCAQTLPGMLT